MAFEIRQKINQSFLWKISAAAVLLAAALFFCANLKIINSSKEKIYKNISLAPEAQAVMILGAKVGADGSLSDMYKDRVDTAIEVYRSGKAGKILISGDHSRIEYDEVNSAKDYLILKGIPAQDIFLDHAGFDTYDSLYRARDIFKIKSLIICTQNFHLPRAIYIGRNLGIETCGISADKHLYGNEKFYEMRETLARTKAWLDVSFRVKPKFLGEAIPITGDSWPSWDEN